MSKDKRVKGCLNTECSRYKKKRFKETDRVCDKCNTKLVFVCAKCFKELSEEGFLRKICANCEADLADNQYKFKRRLKFFGSAFAGLALAVLAGIMQNKPEISDEQIEEDDEDDEEQDESDDK